MSGGQVWGFDSIGAVATKKPFGSEAVQMTFPEVFAETFAVAKGSKKGYIGGEGEERAELPQGDDFQSHYHAQKKRDADRMANAKVDSTRKMNARAFSSHCGYFGMPQPQLGQRHFANPSQGAEVVYSSRQDYRNAPFNYEGVNYTGGVLRTAEGQGYAKSILMNRIQQFNAIDANVGNFTPDPRGLISQPTSTTESFENIHPTEGTTSKIELNQLLRSINDAFTDSTDDIDTFTYKDTTRALSLIFRLVPMMEDYEVSDLQSVVSDILNKLNSVIANQQETSVKNYEIALTLTELFDKIHTYLAEFSNKLAEGSRTEKQKVQISKGLVSSLGFARFLQKVPSQIIRSVEQSTGQPVFPTEPASRRKSIAKREQKALAEATRGLTDPTLRQSLTDLASNSRFSELAPTRESQRALEVANRSGLGTFDVDTRGKFGDNAGHFYRTEGRDVGYLEEGIDGPPEPPIVQQEGINMARISTGPTAPVVRESVPEVRGVWDNDTQQFNVAPQEPRRLSIAEYFGAPRTYPEIQGPTYRIQDLPTTLEGFDRLAKENNARPPEQRYTKDGRPIQVYASSSVVSARKNFLRRFRLTSE